MTSLILTILAGILIWIAMSAATRSGSKNPFDALQHATGFATSTLLMLALLVFALPLTLSFMKNKALPKYWGPVFTELWDDSVDAQVTAADFIDGRISIKRPEFITENAAPAATTSPVVTNPQKPEASHISGKQTGEPIIVQAGINHTVQAGDTLKEIADQYNVSVDEIVTKNGIRNPNNISVGDIFVIQDEITVIPTPEPVVEAAAPQPTATPKPSFSNEFKTLEIAKREGNIDTAVQVINSILQIEPENLVARTYQAEINLAYDVVEDWNTLTVNIVSGPSTSEIESYLAGFEFRVKSIEDGLNMKMKREEEMVLICTSLNWLNGHEVTISRFDGERMGFYNVGDTLTVEG